MRLKLGADARSVRLSGLCDANYDCRLLEDAGPQGLSHAQISDWLQDVALNTLATYLSMMTTSGQVERHGDVYRGVASVVADDAGNVVVLGNRLAIMPSPGAVECDHWAKETAAPFSHSKSEPNF